MEAVRIATTILVTVVGAAGMPPPAMLQFALFDMIGWQKIVELYIVTTNWTVLVIVGAVPVVPITEQDTLPCA